MYKYLSVEKAEHVISKQILRSGISIGANIVEENYAQTKADMITKFAIALKESAETMYRIELLNESEYITDTETETIKQECEEVVKLLTSSIKTLKA